VSPPRRGCLLKPETWPLICLQLLDCLGWHIFWAESPNRNFVIIINLTAPIIPQVFGMWKAASVEQPLGKVIVSLENVSREYDRGKIRAVDNICLKVHSGEFIVLVGTSGSGKTTLLNLMTGLDTPTSGIVRFNGATPTSKGDWSSVRCKHIGFIFQSFNLLPTLTSLENVEIPMFGIGLNCRNRHQRAKTLLQKVGLSHRSMHLPSQLSGGERQRVAIARSLANRPSLLVADEPTGSLDSHSSKQIMALIEEIHLLEKKTLFMVTHDQTLAARASRVVHIVDGRIVHPK